MAEGKVETTLAPELPVEAKGVRLSTDKRSALGTSLWSSIDYALGARTKLDAALESWNDLYELRVSPKVFPWPNASNLAPLLIPTMVDTMMAQLSGMLFVQRFFIVSGNDEQASQTQHEVERFYNTELWRHGWLSAFQKWLHLSIRDGTSFMEVLWRKTLRKRKFVVMAPDQSPDGMPMLDDQGQPVLKSQVVEKEILEYDNVELTPVALKDLLLIPAWSPSVDDASAVCRALWLDEPDLKSRVKSGEMWADAVETALTYVSPGEDERGADRQGTGTADAGGRINVGSSDEAASSDSLGKAKGAIKVWRVHSVQYDLDGDGTCEENIFWVHDGSGTLLGYDTYPYFHGKRPFIGLAPFPRPEQTYGYSLIERLAPLNSELAAVKNQRRDFLDYTLNPIRTRVAGSNVKEDKGWYPGKEIEVGQTGDVQYLALPQVPQAAFIEDSMLNTDAEKFTGLSNPMQGGPTSGKRTAKEIQMAMQSAGVRLNMIAGLVRDGAKSVFEQMHELNLQYGPDAQTISAASQVGGPQQISIDKQKLGLDYTLDIAGNGGPLDKNQAAQDALFLYTTLSQNPLVMNDPVKLYRVTRMLVEAHQIGDAATLIGTEDEVVQKAQAAQQQAQQQAAMGIPPAGQQPGGQQPQGQHPPNGMAAIHPPGL